MFVACVSLHFTFDPEFYDVTAVFQAVKHLAAIEARVAGA